MTFDEYQAKAYRTANKTLDASSQVDNAVFGLIGEIGEIVDLLKKHRYQGHDLDRHRVYDELGDLMWYVALLATTLDIPLDLAASSNIAKLLLRYPGDGFDAEQSRSRVAP